MALPISPSRSSIRSRRLSSLLLCLVVTLGCSLALPCSSSISPVNQRNSEAALSCRNASPHCVWCGDRCVAINDTTNALSCPPCDALRDQNVCISSYSATSADHYCAWTFVDSSDGFCSQSNGCSERRDPASCSKGVEGICAWCNHRCVGTSSKPSDCQPCSTITDNATLCINSFSSQPQLFYCWWEAGQCHDDYCAVRREAASCGHYSAGGCAWCGTSCRVAISNPTCPKCTTYSNASTCSNGYSTESFTNFCYWLEHEQRCVGNYCPSFTDAKSCGELNVCFWCRDQCRSLQEAKDSSCQSCELWRNESYCTSGYSAAAQRNRCSWIKNRCFDTSCPSELPYISCYSQDEGCGMCNNTCASAYASRLQCHPCATFTDESTCVLAVNSVGGWCHWKDNRCIATKCGFISDPVRCAAALDGSCAWCGDSCVDSLSLSIHCPACVGIQNATTCQSSYSSRSGGLYCRWANGRCYGDQCAPAIDPQSCVNVQAEEACSWCGNRCGPSYSAICPPCRSITNNITCESSASPHSSSAYCHWSSRDARCYDDACAAMPDFDHCVIDRHCAWCGSLCISHNSRLAQCPPCSSILQKSTCEWSYSRRSQRCFWGEDSCHDHLCAWRLSPTICANSTRPSCVWCGEQGCVDKYQFNTLHCPLCTTIFTESTCINSYAGGRHEGGDYCVWSNGRCQQVLCSSLDFGACQTHSECALCGNGCVNVDGNATSECPPCATIDNTTLCKKSYSPVTRAFCKLHNDMCLNNSCAKHSLAYHCGIDKQTSCFWCGDWCTVAGGGNCPRCRTIADEILCVFSASSSSGIYCQWLHGVCWDPVGDLGDSCLGVEVRGDQQACTSDRRCKWCLSGHCVSAYNGTCDSKCFSLLAKHYEILPYLLSLLATLKDLSIVVMLALFKKAWQRWRPGRSSDVTRNKALSLFILEGLRDPMADLMMFLYMLYAVAFLLTSCLSVGTLPYDTFTRFLLVGYRLLNSGCAQTAMLTAFQLTRARARPGSRFQFAFGCVQCACFAVFVFVGSFVGLAFYFWFFFAALILTASISSALLFSAHRLVPVKAPQVPSHPMSLEDGKCLSKDSDLMTINSNDIRREDGPSETPIYDQPHKVSCQQQCSPSPSEGETADPTHKDLSQPLLVNGSRAFELESPEEGPSPNRPADTVDKKGDATTGPRNHFLRLLAAFNEWENIIVQRIHELRRLRCVAVVVLTFLALRAVPVVLCSIVLQTSYNYAMLHALAPAHARSGYLETMRREYEARSVDCAVKHFEQLLDADDADLSAWLQRVSFIVPFA